MQIAQAGVTVQPLTFHFGVLLLSGGATTGGTTASGTTGGTTTGGTTGGFTTGGFTTGGFTTGGSTTGGTTTGGTTGGSTSSGGGGGFAPGVLGLVGLLLGGLGLAASAPPQQPPAVGAGPAVIAPATTAPAPVVAETPGAPPGAQAPRSTPAPIVLAASAAQPPAEAPAASPAKQGPGVVLPYTGANLWLPIAAGSGLVGLGVWLRMFGRRFPEDDSQQG